MTDRAALTGDVLQDSKQKLLVDMLGSVSKSTGGWCVLVLDDDTTRIISAIVGLSDIIDYGVSLVDNISKRREPFPVMAGVYFLSPTQNSIARLIDDFSLSSQPQYKEAHVFFSSPVHPAMLSHIKACSGLVTRLKSLKEVNMEYVALESRVITTDQDAALQEVFGDGVGSSMYKQAVMTCARRLATVFATLREMPSIRYRANVPSPDQLDLVPDSELRRIVPQTVAKELYTMLQDMQKSGSVPESDTCDLIIVDRGFDLVAPLIHEWTYEAMMYDLLPGERLRGKVYVRAAEGGEAAARPLAQRDHMLDHADKLWMAVRHQHFGHASRAIAQAVGELQDKEKRVNAQGTGGVKQMETSQIRRMLQSLPQYQEMKTQAGVHVSIATELNRTIDRDHLQAVGRLEQDVVFGDGTGKEVTTFFQDYPQLSSATKSRLLACYLATHPERLDNDTERQWATMGKLTAHDMRALENMEYLLCPVFRRAKGMARLKAGLQQMTGKKRAVRKDRDGDEVGETLDLSRFEPLMAELLDDLVAGKLSQGDYPNIAGTAPPPSTTSSASPARASALGRGGAVLGRGATRGNVLGGRGADGGSVLGGRGRGERPGWASTKSQMGMGSGSSGELSRASKARKVFVFILGGAVRSEVRVAHTRSQKLNREVVLVTTSLETPTTFMEKLARIGKHRFSV